MRLLKYYKHQVVNYQVLEFFKILVLVIKSLCHKSRQCNMILTSASNSHHYKTVTKAVG